MSLLQKRVVDLVLGSLLALAALPVVLVLAVAVTFSLRTWPFFSQQRIGHRGRPFRIIKLRTLPRHSPRYTSKYDLDFASVPRLARFLRAAHLDELPQLFLVPLGHMSLVGPRPEMEILHRELDPGFAALRTGVRPGCAGLWQITSAASRLIGETPEYDICYISNLSFRFDMWILWRSFLLIACRQPRCDLNDVPKWVDVGAEASLRHENRFARSPAFRLASEKVGA